MKGFEKTPRTNPKERLARKIKKLI